MPIAQNSYSATQEELTPLDIIQQIESNLVYKKEVPTFSKEKDVVIDRGWNAEKYKYTETKGSEVEISVQKSGKRNIDLERQAYQAVELGHIEVAVDLYKEILKKDPKNSYALFGLATSYHTLGQYKQAKPIYLDLLKIFPGNEEVMGNLLAIITEESPYDAVYLLVAMADRNPNSGFINAQTAIAYNNIKDYSNAMKYLSKALELEPNNIQYKYNLAVMFDRADRRYEAIRLYSDIIRSAKYNEIVYYMPVNKLQERIDYLKSQN